jgi:hypothetical protein
VPSGGSLALSSAAPMVTITYSGPLPATPTPTPSPTSTAPAAQPRPDLAGKRIQAPGTPAIFLVDDNGTTRYIPDPTTYNNLFRDWSGIQAVDPAIIAAGPPLTSGAYLATSASGGGAIYLVSNGQKRHVSSPASMDKFWLNWGTVQSVPQSTLDGLPNGPDVV